MSEFKGMTRHGRRARVAALVVGAALSLPSLAVANHTTCDKQSNEAGAGINCPEFSPGLDAVVSSRVIDSESTLSYEYSQADHESSTMLIEAYAPLGWQFNTDLPASAPGACDGTVGISAMSVKGDNTPPYDPGIVIPGNSWRRSVRTGTGRTVAEQLGVAYFEDYSAGTIYGCARFASGGNMPFTITQLDGSHPYAATAGWKITISTRAFIESIASTQGSLTRFHFDLNQRDGIAGTYASTRQIFSQASATPVTTDLRVDATTCRRGLDSTTVTGCRGDATLTKLVKSAPFNISPAPVGAPIDYARLTGPNKLAGTNGETGGVATRREGFGLVHGSNSATVTWTAPSSHPDETVKAYALVIAIPADQGSRSGKYITAPATSTVLTSGSLPRFDGNGSLNPDLDGFAKYDVALITIYASGKRTDGLCDDGTVYGTLCAPTTPLWNIKTSQSPGYTLPSAIVGTSTWQFLWRTRTYSSVTMQAASSKPYLLLFVDFPSKEAELVIYGGYQIKTTSGSIKNIEPSNAGDRGTSFKSRSNLISGDAKNGLVAFSNNASPTGTALRFDYVGQTTAQFGSKGLISLLDPGDVALTNGNLTSSRPTSAATTFMQGTTNI